MTDKQINAAIDKFTGCDGNECCCDECHPDWCNDLNAMYKAEKSLYGYEQIHTYVWNLSNREDWDTDFKLMEVHISARDRAEAFLRTLGKWEEVQG